MEHLITEIFGEGKDLTTLQVCVRMVVMFFTALLLIRLGGLRIFGKKSSFDEIIIIMFGAILSRGVTGTVPFETAVAAGSVMIIIHKIVSILCIKSKAIAHLIEGEPLLLFKNGVIIHKNLWKCALSTDAFMESLRLSTNKESLDEVSVAYMENNGTVSFILKSEEAN